jgi:thiol-disulfide isomerase/thioredoxin
MQWWWRGTAPALLALLAWTAFMFGVVAPQGLLPKDKMIGKKAEEAPKLRAYPAELTVADLNQKVADVPDGTYVMIELYASWCPHCRQFKPTYDKVGAFFNGDPHLPGPPVWVARIDCADTVSFKPITSLKI